MPAPSPETHPALPSEPILPEEALSSGDRVGRAPRRLSVDQLRASLLAATGFTWVASRRVSDSDAESGFRKLPDADMLEALAPTLGRADYATTTSDSVDPAVTFSKLAGDAARAACRASIQADLATNGERRILHDVKPRDTLASQEAAVRANLSYLALRFWGRTIAPRDPELAALLTLFDRASVARPEEGWRAVCIAMATDPQFLTY
jgi:hypothetical protein